MPQVRSMSFRWQLSVLGRRIAHRILRLATRGVFTVLFPWFGLVTGTLSVAGLVKRILDRMTRRLFSSIVSRLTRALWCGIPVRTGALRRSIRVGVR